MFTPHPSLQLTELFSLKPYQGAAPQEAKFLFIGLDANYDARIQDMPIFPMILEYHNDGVAFWKKYGVHHPFLLPGYNGDGKYYHQSFANIGFSPEHASQVSFIELLHIPTVGRNKLEVSDLNFFHLKRVNDVILNGKAQHIFIPSGVARLMFATGFFSWLKKKPACNESQLGVYYRAGNKTVFSHLHFSNYGKFLEQKRREALLINELINNG